ncbi:hypothetical protein EV383_4387 [Pseudonocardia sediminis]|uniref:Uncharacterized protein n=1 Tax=Pseudonocardia sediminis TaxID=1397368 RepID=A0A4Q7V422_PSEST|nr:hypothetical protein [Pseudonocardia sediminis]RZT87463.1 hypothetical protein EV383_4387 [Pseudonocardia sediminis]
MVVTVSLRSVVTAFVLFVAFGLFVAGPIYLVANNLPMVAFIVGLFGFAAVFAWVLSRGIDVAARLFRRVSR